MEDSFGGVLTSIYDAVNRLTSRQFGGTGQTPLRIDLTYTDRDQLADAARATATWPGTHQGRLVARTPTTPPAG